MGDGCVHDPDHPSQFRIRCDERGHQHDDMSQWPEQQASPPHLPRDVMADTLSRRVRGAAPAVFHKLDTDHVAALANLSDVRKIRERAQQPAKPRDPRTEAPQRPFGTKNVQVGQGHRAAEGVSRIAVTVKERFPFIVLA